MLKGVESALTINAHFFFIDKIKAQLIRGRQGLLNHPAKTEVEKRERNQDFTSILPDWQPCQTNAAKRKKVPQGTLEFYLLTLNKT